jgi:hypothetical protein
VDKGEPPGEDLFLWGRQRQRPVAEQRIVLSQDFLFGGWDACELDLRNLLHLFLNKTI